MGILPYVNSRYYNLFLNIYNSNFKIIASRFSWMICHKNIWRCFLWRRKLILSFDDLAQRMSQLRSSFELHYNCQNNIFKVNAGVDKNNYILWIAWKFCFIFIWTEKQYFNSSTSVIIIAHCTIHVGSQDLDVVVLIKYSQMNLIQNTNGSMFFLANTV